MPCSFVISDKRIWEGCDGGMRFCRTDRSLGLVQSVKRIGPIWLGVDTVDPEPSFARDGYTVDLQAGLANCL